MGASLDHRRRQRPGPARDGQADGRRRRARLHPGRRRRRGQAPDRRRRRRDRSRRSARRTRSRTRCAACGPGGTLSSLGVYSGKLEMPYDAFAAGLGDHRIVTTLCPGGKERMRRLIATVRVGPLRPAPAHHPPVRARRHRRGLRPVQQPPRRRPEGRDPPVDSTHRPNALAHPDGGVSIPADVVRRTVEGTRGDPDLGPTAAEIPNHDRATRHPLRDPGRRPEGPPGVLERASSA